MSGEQEGKLEDTDEGDSGISVQLRMLSVRYLAAAHAEQPEGTWRLAAWLLVTSTAQPVLLSLPFAMACLGWGGGLAVLAAAALATTYCNLLLARMHEYGGKRHILYRHMARDIMGPRHPYAYHTVLLLQFSVIVGVGIANLILCGQVLRAVYALYCGDDCVVSQAVWTVVAGVVLLAVSQLPALSKAELLAAVSSVFMVTYSLCAVVLAGVQGGGRGADYSIPGSPVDRVMNGFNAIGIAVFVFTNLIVPEIQATLAPEPATGSSYGPMWRATLAAMTTVSAIYLTVAIVGYWAYGNSVESFLLSMNTHPKWLLTILNIMCAIQLIIGEQVFEFVLYDSWEPRLVARFPRAAWLHREQRSPEGRRVLVPSRLCMLAVRAPYVAAITAVAATLPFFAYIVGFVGAVGLAPLQFTFPLAMYLIAQGSQLSRPSYWAHAALAVAFTGAGALAAVGAVRGIVVAIQHHEFF